MNYILYEIVNIKTHKKYVGVTATKLKERWCCHLWRLRKGKHNEKLQRAYDMYGEDSFEIRLIQEGNKEQIFLLEKELTKETVINGYNVIIGGGDSEERRSSSMINHDRLNSNPEAKKLVNAKISAANKGKKMSAEARKKMSQQKIGEKWSPELRKKISQLRMGRAGTRDNYYMNTDMGVFFSTVELGRIHKVSRISINNWYAKNDKRISNFIKVQKNAS